MAVVLFVDVQDSMTSPDDVLELLVMVFGEHLCERECPVEAWNWCRACGGRGTWLVEYDAVLDALGVEPE